MITIIKATIEGEERELEVLGSANYLYHPSGATHVFYEDGSIGPFKGAVDKFNVHLRLVLKRVKFGSIEYEVTKQKSTHVPSGSFYLSNTPGILVCRDHSTTLNTPVTIVVPVTE